MTHEHLEALLKAGEATKNGEGWSVLPDGRSLTLYVAAGSSTMNIGRVQSLKQDGPLVHARTTKSELYIVAMGDAFAGSLDAPASIGKKAGFL